MMTSIHEFITAYPRSFLCAVMLIAAAVACLNPPRDNEYDPQNPGKAMISGTVYGLNEQPVADAEVSLWQDTEMIDTTRSDAEGYYEIGSIDPGIYRIVARAPHFVQWECYPESLPADTVANVDIWFCAQYYCFEEENLGTVQPFGFDTLGGTWAVVEDGTGPDYHSTPNVYHGENTAARPAAAMLKYSGPDFHLETKFKILSSSGAGWMTGAVFGFHNDTLNYYFVGVTHFGVGLNKMINGVVDTLQVVSHAFMPDTWYDLAVQMCGQEIYIFADGAEINYTDNNQPFSGKVGLWVDNPSGATLVNFDDVLIGR